MLRGQTTPVLLAAGRIAYGAALTLAPARAGGRWLGSHADDAGAQVALRGLGARDLALGAGALIALRSRQHGVAPIWLAAQATADATDLASTLLARQRLPAGGVRAAVAIAGAAVGLDVAAALALTRSERQTAARA